MSDKKMRFKTIKKTSPNTSVDGFVPRRQSAQSPMAKVSKPEYYGTASTISGGPRRPLAKRRDIPTETLEVPETDDEVLTLGNFDQPESNVFEENPLLKESSPKFGKRRNDKGKEEPSDKKEKKRGRIRTWWKNRPLKIKIGIIGGLILIGLITAGGFRLYSFFNSVFGRGVGNGSSSALSDEVKPDQLNTEGDGRLNMLLMGRGGTENEAPDLTDTLLIASIDIKNQTASMLSVPRDTWVESNGSSSKINAVYALTKQGAIYRGKSNDDAEKAGIQAVIASMREVSGVPIHKYVLTDYKAFRDVVNAMGGVDVTVPESIYDNFTGWRFKAGKQTMDGLTALKYARTRHGSARGDFDRSENQRRLLVAMRSKATSTGIVANPVRLNALANAVQKNIRTDLSIDEAKTLFNKTSALPESSIKSLDLADPKKPLVMTGQAGGQSIVKPIAGLSDYTEIRAYARTNMIDPFIRKEAPTVAVYNGSGKTGLATIVGDVLSGYGYKVLIKETSKSTQPKTLIVRTNKDAKKPFTERYLTVRFKGVITTDMPANVAAMPSATTSSSSSSSTTTAPTPDYTIILGTDFRVPNGPTW